MTGVAVLPRGPVACTVARLRARRERRALDAALARGRSPWSSALLHARAQEIAAAGHRRRVARALLAMIELAGRPRRAGPSLGLRREAILAHREALAVLAERLAHPAPVDVAVVARLGLLAWDPASPAFTSGGPVEELHRTLAACLGQLAG